MKKVLIWLVALGGGFLALLIAAVLLLPKFIDVESYLPEIEKKVTEATGRSFSLGKDADVSVFPWAGVSFNNVQLGNPEAFGGGDFVKVKSFEVRVEIMPLLSKKIEINKFVIDGPEILLVKSADGSGNWSIGGAPQTPPDVGEKEAKPAEAKPAVAKPTATKPKEAKPAATKPVTEEKSETETGQVKKPLKDVDGKAASTSKPSAEKPADSTDKPAKKPAKPARKKAASKKTVSKDASKPDTGTTAEEKKPRKRTPKAAKPEASKPESDKPKAKKTTRAKPAKRPSGPIAEPEQGTKGLYTLKPEPAKKAAPSDSDA
jgi:uncharacterized protein involved in outer membrane biogenesis